MEQAILFIFLILFPFGQIIRFGIIQPIDIVVGIGAIWAIYKKFPKPKIFKYFQNFLIFATFSWLFSVFIFKSSLVLYGILYLVRLAAYFYFFLFIFNLTKSKSSKSLILNSLLVISVVSAIFGWIQFFIVPDIKPFFAWGWDMHLLRLVGTFLDPAFLGLIIVLGSLIALTKKNYLLFIFFVVSLAFTYSRASYLAFAIGIGYLFYSQKKIKYILYSLLILGALILVLPTSRNHSIEFLRSFSAIARLEDYKISLNIFSRSPIFGIGYDNMCIAYQKYIGPQDFTSHACSGSDSSLLFVLATTGVAGFIAFILLMKKVWLNSNTLFKASALALLTHSTFSNSIFYSWILGYILILLAIA